MAVQLNDLYASTLVRGQKLYTDYEYKYFDARTNYVLNSMNPSSCWVTRPNQSTVVSGGPDGNAYLTVDFSDAGAGTHYIQCASSGFLSESDAVVSVYVRAKTPADVGKKLNFIVLRGSWSFMTKIVVTLAASWERVNVPYAAGGAITYIYLMTGTTSATMDMFSACGADVACLQAEAGLDPSWYIPTTDTTVTKPAGLYSRLNPLAFKRTALWGASTNKCTCRKANPTDTSNLTKSGDAAAVLSVVDDTAALAAAGLDKICTSGKVYKLDNSAGSIAATASLIGNTTDGSTYSHSIYFRGSGEGTLKLNVGGKAIIFGSAYTRDGEDGVVSSGVRNMAVVANAGAVVYFILPQLEESPYCTPPIFKASDGTDPLTSLTRPNTKLVGQSAGVLRGNNLALMGQVIPGASGQSNYCYLFSSFIDITNYLGINTGLTGSQIRMRKVVDSVASEVTPIEYPPIANTPFQWQAYLSSSYGMGIRVRYWLGMAWSAWTDWATNADTQDAPIASTFEIGSRNNGNRFVGNYQMLRTYWSADPKAWLESQG